MIKNRRALRGYDHAAGRDDIPRHPVFLNFRTRLGALRVKNSVPHAADADFEIFERDEALSCPACPGSGIEASVCSKRSRRCVYARSSGMASRSASSWRRSRGHYVGASGISRGARPCPRGAWTRATRRISSATASRSQPAPAASCEAF